VSETQARSNTYFAPAARATRAEIEEQVRQLARSPLVETLLETYDGYLLILNEQRQVLSANKRVLADLGASNVAELTGDRPGELLACVNAQTAPGGCGTSRACSTCGAVISILTAQSQDGPAVGECLMTVEREGHVEALEFRVRATQLHFGDQSVTLFVLEVEDHRVLLLAENGELAPEPSRVAVAEILGLLETVFREHKAAAQKRVVIAAVDPAFEIETDAGLLLRVLTNMVKNALEAVAPGETVNVRYRHDERAPAFQVWNAGVIPERIGLQIFRRSFTTKNERGRGLGAYSMKLLGERYLGGRVGFESNADDGTTFWIELPPTLQTSDSPPP